MMLSFALGTVLPTCQTAKVRGVALWVGGQSHASYSTPFQSSPTPHLPGQPTLVSACLCPSAGVPGEEKDGRLWKRETGWGGWPGVPQADQASASAWSSGDQSEHRLALRNIASMVRCGGLLVIDHRNYDHILSTGCAPPGKNIYYKVGVSSPCPVRSVGLDSRVPREMTEAHTACCMHRSLPAE